MKNLFRYFRIYLFTLRNSVMIMLSYRTNLLMWTIIHAFELLTNIVFFNIIFLRAGSVGGWNINQVLVLLGFMEMTLGLGSLTFYPMMYNFNKMIRKGELDLRLVKPVDTQFLISFPWVDLDDFISIPTGLLLMGYGISQLGVQNLTINILAFIPSLILAEIIMYSIIVFLLCLAFRTTTVNYIENVFWNIQWQGRYPATVFRGIIHAIFMFIVPIGLISTIPAQVLFGRFDWRYFLIMVVYAVGGFLLSRKAFSNNLKRYSSASS